MINYICTSLYFNVDNSLIQGSISSIFYNYMLLSNVSYFSNVGYFIDNVCIYKPSILSFCSIICIYLLFSPVLLIVYVVCCSLLQ